MNKEKILSQLWCKQNLGYALPTEKSCLNFLTKLYMLYGLTQNFNWSQELRNNNIDQFGGVVCNPYDMKLNGYFIEISPIGKFKFTQKFIEDFGELL